MLCLIVTATQTEREKKERKEPTAALSIRANLYECTRPGFAPEDALRESGLRCRGSKWEACKPQAVWVGQQCFLTHVDVSGRATIRVLAPSLAEERWLLVMHRL